MCLLWNALYLGVVLPKPYIPRRNSHTKGTSLAYRLAPDMISIARNYAVWAITPPKKNTTYRAIFFGGGACKTPVQKFGHFLWVYAPSYRFTSVVSNTVEIGHDKFLKGRIVLVTEKKQNTRIGAVWWNPWGDFLKKIFCASAHCGPTLLIHVSSKSVQVWGSYNRKTLWLPKWF